MTEPIARAPLPADELGRLAKVLRRALRHGWVALAAALACGAIGGTAVLLVPRHYRSEAVLQYREGMQWSAGEPVNTRRVAQRLREVALSRAQLSRVVDDLGLHPELVAAGRKSEAVEEVRLATSFRFDQSDVFVLAYDGETPEQARRVTTHLVDLLVAENARVRADQAELARRFLQEEKSRKAADLAEREAAQIRFLARHPEFAQEQGAGGMGVSLRTRPEREASAAAAVSEEAAQRAARPSPREAALTAARNAAETRLTTALRDLAERRSRLTEEHPDVQVAARNAVEAEQAYRKAAEALAAVQGPALPPPVRRPAVSPSAGPVRAPESVVALETEWARLSREVNEARDRLQQLDDQQFRATMTASMVAGGQTGQILVIDPPFLPARPVGIRQNVLLLMVAAVSLAIGLALAVVLGVLDDVVYDASDVERLEIAPVLVEVAPWDARDRSRAALPGRHARDAGSAYPGGPIHAGPGHRMEPRLLAAGWRDEDAPEGSASPAAAAAGADPGPGEPPPPAPSDESGPSGAAGTDGTIAVVELEDVGRASCLVASPDCGAFESPLFPHVVCVHRVPPSDLADGRVVMLDAPDTPAAASFRILRHRLAQRGAGPILLVSSPHRGEGKTSTAVNLALALGENGRERVLLLEGNFREPSLARLLGFQPPVCLSDQLAFHRTRPEAPWVVTETVVPWLHAAAVAPDRPAPLLDGGAFADLLAQLRDAGYAHVVVDGPPVLEGADAALLEEQVDGILLTLRARSSRARALRDSAARLDGRKVLGVVLLEG